MSVNRKHIGIQKRLVIIIFIFMLFALVLFLVWIGVLVTMGVTQKNVDYYKNDSIYDEIICILEKDDDSIRFKPEVSLDYFNEFLYLWEKNYSVVCSNGFFEEVFAGDRVTVITASGYFWDGYMLPIVGLKTERRVYLNFDEGKENQINQLQEMKKNIYQFPCLY